MNRLFHSTAPVIEQILRALFWSLATLTVALTAYGLAVESYGIGLFLPDQHVPKLQMRVEARLGALSGFTGIGLALLCLFHRRLRLTLRLLGYAIVAFWLYYFSIPRF